MQKNKLNSEIINQIKSGELKMKPKWYFATGSLLLFTSLVVILTGVIFLTNIIIFMIHRTGAINFWRLDTLLGSVPLWIPILAVSGVIAGIYLLKRYDFSYRQNFTHIIIMTLMAIIIASWSIDQLGLNQLWSTHTPMRRFYQQLESHPRGSIRGVHKYAIFN